MWDRKTALLKQRLISGWLLKQESKDKLLHAAFEPCPGHVFLQHIFMFLLLFIYWVMLVACEPIKVANPKLVYAKRPSPG